MGLPLHIDGTENDIAHDCRRFGELLAKEFNANLVFHDEHRTSVEAETYIRRTMGISKPEKVKELLDAVAAAFILQGYLDAQKRLP